MPRNVELAPKCEVSQNKSMDTTGEYLPVPIFGSPSRGKQICGVLRLCVDDILSDASSMFHEAVVDTIQA